MKLIFAVAFVIGAAASSWGQGLSYEVASIRPTDPGFGGWGLNYTADGFSARGVPLQTLIKEAYGMWDDDRIFGTPEWGKWEHYDVKAKVGSEDTAKLLELSQEERRAMLQKLLAERFGLKLHRETRLMDVYVLGVDKRGIRLQRAAEEDAVHTDIKGHQCLFTKSNLDYFVGKSCTVQDITGQLRQAAGRPVVNETGLSARYDMELHWLPENAPASWHSDSGIEGPPLTQAVEKQLGLKLVPARRPLEVLLVDKAEKPSDN